MRLCASVDRVLAAPARQQGAGRAQVQHDADGIVERVRLVGDGVERHPRGAPLVGGEAELAADGDQRAGDGMVEDALGQDEAGVGAGAGLAERIFGDHAAGDRAGRPRGGR